MKIKDEKEVIFNRIQKAIFDGFSKWEGWKTIDDIPEKSNEIIRRMAEKEFNENDNNKKY